jgi:predicted RNase H-like HicB family nuclease/DNA-binding XRE family transcriptional regulator
VRYHFEIHKEEDGFWGECVELDTVVSEGTTMDELKANLADALEGVLLSILSRNIPHPLPDKVLDSNSELVLIDVPADLAFGVILRHYRITQHLSQKSMQEKLGFKSRNSYVKLESAGNPTLKTTDKILKAFPDFPITECFA